MPATEPIMPKTMNVADVRQHLAEVLNDVHGGKVRVLVEKDGVPVAGIVSARDLERLRLFEEQRAKDFEILDEIGEAFKDVPAGDIERQVARALAAVRRKRRARANTLSPSA